MVGERQCALVHRTWGTKKGKMLVILVLGIGWEGEAKVRMNSGRTIKNRKIKKKKTTIEIVES